MHSLVTRRRDWERIAAAALLLLAVLWRLPFLGAGIDYKDTGYYLAGYKHAFSPGGLDDIGLFMTNLTGGLLYRLLPSHHLLAFRALDAVAYAGIAVMLFRTLRGALPDAALAGVLLAASLVVRRLPMTLSYNTFTALFCAAAFCLLYTGLAKGKPRLAALPGLAVGLGVFYRVPNVLQLGYCAAIAWHFLLCERDLRRMGKHLLRFFLGALGGLLIAFLCMFAAIGPGAALDSLLLYARTFLSGGGGYSLPYFLDIFARQVRDLSSSLFGNQPFSVLRLTYLTGLLCLLLGLPTAVLIRRRSPRDSLLLFLCAQTAVFLAIGSNTVMNLWSALLAPLLLGTLVSLRHLLLLIPGIRPARRALLAGCMAGLLAMGAFYALRLYNNNYLDARVAELTDSVPAPELAGMRTTPRRAGDLRTADELLSRPDVRGRELIVMGSFPLGAVLADSRLFFSEPWGSWPDLASININRVTGILREKEEEGVRPAILVSWLEINDEPTRKTFRGAKKVEAVLAFAQRNGYVLAYKDADFELHVPPGGPDAAPPAAVGIHIP